MKPETKSRLLKSIEELRTVARKAHSEKVYNVCDACDRDLMEQIEEYLSDFVLSELNFSETRLKEIKENIKNQKNNK